MLSKQSIDKKNSWRLSEDNSEDNRFSVNLHFAM